MIIELDSRHEFPSATELAPVSTRTIDGCDRPDIGTCTHRPIGAPRCGQTTVARRLSAEIGAVHVRLDTIEAAMTASGVIDRAGGWATVPDAGYRVAYAVVSDLLSAKHDVVADSVNPVAITRRAWADTAQAGRATLIEVEVTCSDKDLHRRRVKERSSDIEGLTVPTWQQVDERLYEPWDRWVLRVDTTAGSGQAAETIAARLRGPAR